MWSLWRNPTIDIFFFWIRRQSTRTISSKSSSIVVSPTPCMLIEWLVSIRRLIRKVVGESLYVLWGLVSVLVVKFLANAQLKVIYFFMCLYQFSLYILVDLGTIEAEEGLFHTLEWVQRKKVWLLVFIYFWEKEGLIVM